jgi:DNA-binding CsgD family transcriptional regulator
VKLSSREREVLHALSQGATYAEVAEALDIAYGTVGVHVWHAAQKMGVIGREAVLERFCGGRSRCQGCGELMVRPAELCGFCRA